MSSFKWVEIGIGDTDVRHAIYCDPDGTNDGSKDDDGELQSATISSVTSITPDPAAGLAINSKNLVATNIHGDSYLINTLINVWMAATVAGNYKVEIIAVTSDGRTLNRDYSITVTDL